MKESRMNIFYYNYNNIHYQIIHTSKENNIINS